MKFLALLPFLVTTAFAAQKIYEITQCDNCQGNQPIMTVLEITNGTLVPNKAQFSGYLEVKEKISGPLEFSFDANRCDFAMKKCEKYNTMKTPGLCELFQSKGGIFEDALKTFEPRMKCPLMPGRYIAKNTVIDLSTLSVFPTEGFVWVVTIKGVSGEGKNKKLAMCLQVETKISKVKERRKKN